MEVLEKVEIVPQNIKKNNQENEKKLLISKIEKLIYIFAIGSLIGWVYEVIFYKITENILVNRGFLYGPYLPVYGIGSILIVVLLKKIKKRPLILFFGIMFVTGVLEYIVGAFMLKIWNKRWWDYTGLFLNINGHVCLRSVISFAIGGLALVYLIEPWIDKKIKKIKEKNNRIFCILILGIILIDSIICLVFRNPIK